jgi:hypothetical protein
MSGVMLVDPELLSETPEAFQQYVKEFFTKKKVLGREVLIASTTISNGHHGGKGIAPSHSVDLMRFKDGLKANESLNDWIRKAEGKYLWQFYGVNEHSDCGACDDD